MSELLPCPFCGGTEICLTMSCSLHCCTCGMTGPSADTNAACVKAWNTRTQPVQQAQRLVLGEETYD